MGSVCTYATAADSTVSGASGKKLLRLNGCSSRRSAANRLCSVLLRAGSDRLDRELQAKWTQEPVERLLSWIVSWRNCPQDIRARHANLLGKLAHAIGPNHLRENRLERDPFFDPSDDELSRKLDVAQVLREPLVQGCEPDLVLHRA